MLIRKIRETARAIALVVAGAATMALAPTSAQAVSENVRNACRGDYFQHCSMHSPGSPGVRKCMRAVGERLSNGCIMALLEAGMVPKSKLAKYKAKSQTADAGDGVTVKTISSHKYTSARMGGAKKAATWKKSKKYASKASWKKKHAKRGKAKYAKAKYRKYSKNPRTYRVSDARSYAHH